MHWASIRSRPSALSSCCRTQVRCCLPRRATRNRCRRGACRPVMPRRFAGAPARRDRRSRLRRMRTSVDSEMGTCLSARPRSPGPGGTSLAGRPGGAVRGRRAAPPRLSVAGAAGLRLASPRTSSWARPGWRVAPPGYRRASGDARIGNGNAGRGHRSRARVAGEGTARSPAGGAPGELVGVPRGRRATKGIERSPRGGDAPAMPLGGAPTFARGASTG